MSMEPSAALAYGIDLGEEEDAGRPEFLPDKYDTVEDWVEDDADRKKTVRTVTYGFEGTILAMRGCVHSVGYGGATKEIASLSVDPDKEAAFKALLVAAGIKDPRPRWILSYHVSY